MSHQAIRRTLLVGVIAALTPPSGAQSFGVVGRVYASGDSARPVADAEVALRPSFRIARSDSSGTFRFANVAPGGYTLRVRRVGYAVAMQEVKVDASRGQLGSAAIVLQTGAQLLAEVTISDQRVLYPVRLAEPYARVAWGKGRFFTRESIDSLQPPTVLSLLERVPGVRTNESGIGIERCRLHGANGGTDGKLHVYLDGVRQTDYGKFLSHDALEALRAIDISSVQVVEVHTSINTIPPDYASDACAVILVWSR